MGDKVGIFLHGLFLDIEERHRRDGATAYAWGVACGLQAYQVVVSADDMPPSIPQFGEPVVMRIRVYAGQSGLYMTGKPV